MRDSSISMSLSLSCSAFTFLAYCALISNKEAFDAFCSPVVAKSSFLIKDYSCLMANLVAESFVEITDRREWFLSL